MKSLLTVVLVIFTRSIGFTQDCSAVTGASDGITGLGGYGDPHVDQLIIQELHFLAQCLGVHPAFYFFDDAGGHNAYSTEVSLRDQSADGTVVFGRGLHQDQMLSSLGGTNVPIILAHEFGHTVARKFHLELPTKENELFADYIAGGYMFYRNRDFKSVDMQSAFRAFFNMGDNDFTSSSHHGTPESRTRCLRQGYLDAAAAGNQGHDLTLQDGVNLGSAFVQNNDLP